jgi:transcription-repair coupling factor (superfamily II helicase)
MANKFCCKTLIMNKNTEQFYHGLLPKKGEKIFWQGLYGSAASFVIASAVRLRPLVIITPDAFTSYRLEQELRFFLGKSGDKAQLFVFPGWETLPYDHFSPHEGVVSERGLALYQLAASKSIIILIDASTIMYKLPPKSYVEASSFVLEVGENLDFNFLRKKLENCGYNCVTTVIEHGEFAVRGSIVDIFPMGSKEAYRIDFLDITVDSIRIFDVDTQRSFKNIHSIKVLPAKEFPFNDMAIERFCDKWRFYFDGNPLKCPMYQNISSKKSHPGVEYYLPLFSIIQLHYLIIYPLIPS